MSQPKLSTSSENACKTKQSRPTSQDAEVETTEPQRHSQRKIKQKRERVEVGSLPEVRTRKEEGHCMEVAEFLAPR